MSGFRASTAAAPMRTIIKKTLHTGMEHSMFDACVKSFFHNNCPHGCAASCRCMKTRQFFVHVFTTINVSAWSS
jgi:hypothetical protein